VRGLAARGAFDRCICTFLLTTSHKLGSDPDSVKSESIFSIDMRKVDPYIVCGAEVTIRSFNSQCSSMARPFCLATPLRLVVRVAKSTRQSWINRHGAAVDSGKEGKAP
jgi:hypothetical protein